MSDDFFDDTLDDSFITDDMSEADELVLDAEDQDEREDEVESRSVVLAKQDMIALLGLKTSARGGIIIRLDPREQNPAAQTYDDRDAATLWFNRSLRSSKKNGWIVVYDGTPSFG
jgi:hypothetical protein